MSRNDIASSLRSSSLVLPLCEEVYMICRAEYSADELAMGRKRRLNLAGMQECYDSQSTTSRRYILA